MRFRACHFGCALLLLAGMALSGCLPSVPSNQSQSEEEKEPHYLAGSSAVNAMDYAGAIESFEKALEVNPRSASAHFQLGWLFEQKEPDPAAAIYHYNRYLQLRPQADNAETVKLHIAGCKQELARTVLLGPVSQKVQQEVEQLTEDKKKLMDQNKQLADEVAKWRAYYAGQSARTNQTASLPRPQPVPGSGQTALGGQPLSNSVSVVSTRTVAGAPTRTHTVKSGETPSSIARQYGVRLDALMAANPNLDPRRMRVNQTLTVPAP